MAHPSPLSLDTNDPASVNVLPPPKYHLLIQLMQVCIGTIKALLGFRVNRFGRVLVPFAAGCAALGTPFLGRGQPANDKGEARWAQKGGFDATSRGIGGL